MNLLVYSGGPSSKNILSKSHIFRCLDVLQVYTDLEVAFIISENQTLLNTLAKAGDVTYGRTAISSQFYYGCLFHELLSFQLPERHTNEQVRSSQTKENHSDFC